MRGLILVVSMLFASTAHAGFQGLQENIDGTVTNLDLFTGIQCERGIACSRLGGKMLLGAKTVAQSRWQTWSPAALSSGTATQANTATVYLHQVFVPAYSTLSGLFVLNGATAGTDKYIVGLYNSSGSLVAHSASAGAAISGTAAFQSVAFTAAYTASGPSTYWAALWVSGVTDTFQTVPAAGAGWGLAGTVTTQSFGATPATLTLPTTFTADKGPVAFTY